MDLLNLVCAYTFYCENWSILFWEYDHKPLQSCHVSLLPLLPSLSSTHRVFFSCPICHLETVHLLAVQFLACGKSQKCLLNILLFLSKRKGLLSSSLPGACRAAALSYPLSLWQGCSCPAHALGEHRTAAQKQGFSSLLQAPPSSWGWTVPRQPARSLWICVTALSKGLHCNNSDSSAQKGHEFAAGQQLED